MTETAIRALLSGVVDDAGLFPPASLALAPAIRNYRTYRLSHHSWMLGRFVCPASRLDELKPLAWELFDAGAPLPLSVVLPAWPTAGDLARRAPAFAGELVDLQRSLEGAAAVECLELGEPADLAPSTDPAAIGEALTELASALKPRGLAPAVFVERTLADEFQLPLGALVEALRSFNVSGLSRGLPAWGVKIRCGGVEREDFPPAERIAAAVIACRDGGVPFKATAGLHHPLPRQDVEIGARMQGFLNLFAGAALAGLHGLDVAGLTSILGENKPTGFRISPDRIAWRELELPTADIVRLRRELATSFGSCSFDEPVEDLLDLGLL